MEFACHRQVRRGEVIAALLFLVGPRAGMGQAIGTEVQGYPAGIIVAGRIDLRSGPSLFVGGNFTDRRGFGRHDNEQGNGFGLGLGWRWRRPSQGWQAGVRVDVWWLDIDWQDGGPAPRSGSSTITVLQPTVRVAHRWTVAGGAMAIDLGAAFGLEINVRTSGDEVGDGAILLLGFAVLFHS